ncbi:MAG: ATP-grasp domain-containing protein [Oscillospiraceae bacterium]|nr:ATP-grasp domain-containing protein [Oscillospiraceae bacterium]
MSTAIVTDVRYCMSLPVIRALGREGVRVICVEREVCADSAALGFYSKYSSKNVKLSDPSENTQQFLRDIRKLSEECPERPVIIPVGITTLLALCENREEVEAFADVSLPPLASIELANDKARLIPFAESVGVSVPQTTFQRDGESVEELAARIKYPTVIKLARGEMFGLAPEERYAIIKTKEEFSEKFPRFASYGEKVLVQQYISGDGYGVSAVFGKNGEPLEVFCHRRIREYPASGGPSSFCESAELPELCSDAIKLLRALSWEGVAMVEFKGNPTDGFYLMEINPRLWGSSGLAPNSGCNIPYAIFRAARGETAEHFENFDPKYKVGHKMRFLLQDLLAFPSYLKKSDNRLKYALKFLTGLLNPMISDGVLDIRDIRSSVQYLKQALKKTDSIVR